MSKTNRTIIIILVALLAITLVGAVYNMQYAREKAAMLEAAEISVLENGREVCRLNMDAINKLTITDFTARLKSSVMKSPEEHTYTGIALHQLFASTGISLEDRKRVVVRSVDGYAVPLTIKEIQTLDNIYLVFKDNGEYLGSYGAGNGQGPYMIVIRGDSYSQRWAKYVCELDIQ